MFFIIPIGVDYKAQRWPVVTFTLMGINTFIHIISLFFLFGNQDRYQWWLDTFWLTPASSAWYTYFTSMFMHEGILLHLLGNMVYLYLFGSCVEDLIGRWRYLAFYICGGLVAAFGHILLTPEHFDSDIPFGGASGAISACMGGFVLLMHKSKIEFKWVFVFFIVFIFRVFSGEFFLPAWLVMSFWFGKDLLGAISGMLQNGTGSGIAFGAHVGGFVFGLVVVLCMKPLLRREEERAIREEELAEAERFANAPSEDVSPIPSDAAIFLIDNGEQSGPHSLGYVWQQFKSGGLTSEAHYWHDGMAEWKPLRGVL